ncbi:hypothetical protein FACS1894137_02590 [Spirochaetia bacterium]|nr:hypothetical protein FACS1894137_02590 [Spirochaetia bacterium]
MKRCFAISVFFLSAYLLILGCCSNSNDPDIQEKPAAQDNSGKEAPSEDAEDSTEPDAPNAPDSPDTPDGPKTVKGVKDLQSYLASLPENTGANPYPVKVTGINLASGAANNLKGLYTALSRYVALDLSDCAGEKFAGVTPANALNRKSYVQAVILPRGLRTIAVNAFVGCTELVSVDMPGVDTIMNGAFNGCYKLETVTMEEVVSIKNDTASSAGAFNGCAALSSVSLPKLTEIGKRSFAGCTGLEYLILGETPPTLGNAVFSDNTPGIIYVPAQAIDTYRNISTETTNWTDALKAKIRALP